MTNPPMILHTTPYSGHGHRVELLLSMLDLPYVVSHAPAEVRQTEAFRRLNPLGQIPVLEDGDLVLCDSNAILVHLAKTHAPGSHWLPEDPKGAAAVQRWLSIAAGEVMYGPATARMVVQWNFPGSLDLARTIAARLLVFMEQHLADRTWLATDHVSIADLACWAYVAHAPEGGISLDPYPAIRAWIARVEALPKFKAIPKLPLPQSSPSTGA